MTMRGPELHPGDAALDHLAGSRGEAAGEPHVSGKLQSAPGGAMVVHDLVTTMNVEPDGTANFHDKKDIDIHVRLPMSGDFKQVLRDFGDEVEYWHNDPYARTRYGRTEDLAPHLRAEPGQCDTWGDSLCDDALSPEMTHKRAWVHDDTPDNGGGLLAGKLDITSYLYRKLVSDPYSSRKLKLLDDTRAERAARGAQFRADQLARSAEMIERNLDALAGAQLAPIELRAALFEMWDECAEGDDATGAAGQRARAMVIGWIGGHLPAGSANAYAADELAALDARRTSHQHFAPYGRDWRD